MLPDFPAPPARWPAFTPSRQPPVNRTSIATGQQEVPEDILVALVPPLDIEAGLEEERRKSSDSSGGLDTVAVLLIVIVALLAAALGALAWWYVGSRRRKRAALRGDKKGGLVGAGGSGSGSSGLPALGADATTVRSLQE